MTEANQIPIQHMASFARCGETVLLRTLDAHSSVAIAGQISARDTAREELMRHVRETEAQEIGKTDRRLHGIPGAGGADVIVVKQGIWMPERAFRGFILVRNPASVYASLCEYDQYRLNKDTVKRLLKRVLGRVSAGTDNKERFQRWASGFDPDLSEGITHLDIENAFCALYNYRFHSLLQTGLPLVHYEKFVREPDVQTRYICKLLSVEYEPSMLASENLHNEIGHGRNDLSRRVDAASVYKYRDIISPSTFQRIRSKTLSATKALGYSMEWDKISII